MTKKDYKAIAAIINGSTLVSFPGNIDKLELVDMLCVMLKNDNPNFDADKFKTACYNS
jgi:hypothetical protein